MQDQNSERQPSPNLSTEPGDKSAPLENTSTQAAPSISTEFQHQGDARHPSDTLVRGQDKGPDSIEPRHMPGSAEEIEVAGEGSTTGPSG